MTTPVEARALVLAAGLATRLRPLTTAVAKPALPFVGRPILDRVLDGLAESGLTEVAVNLHHAPDSIRRVVAARAGRLPGVRFSDETAELLGSGGALVPVAAFLAETDDCLLVNGDCVHALDLAALLAQHRHSGADATLAVRPGPEPGFRCLRVDSRSHVTAFGEAPSGASNERHYLSVQVVARRLLATLPTERRVFGLFSDWQAPAAKNGAVIRVHETDAEWHAMDSPEQYLSATADWLALRGGRPHVDATAVIGEGASVDGGCALHAGARVGAGARLVGTVLLDGAVVGARAHVSACILGAGAVVEAGGSVTGRVVMAGAAGPAA